MKGTEAHWQVREERQLVEDLLGEKTRELMTSPPLRVYRCLASFRSHSIAFPSYGRNNNGKGKA